MAVLSESPARSKYERRRREVVDTAARLFAERGYRQTSIDDLVEATGLQRGGLYHYIESKEQLLLLIHEALMGPLLEEAEAIADPAGEPEEQLRRLMRVWIRHVAAHRDHMTVFFEERRLVESAPAWGSLRGSRDAFESLLREVIERGVERGRFAAADTGVALLCVLGIVNYMPVWLDPGGRLGPDELAEACTELLLSGLKPR